MSEQSARIYRRASQSGTSSYEAWADLADLSFAVDWNVEEMLAAADADDTAAHTEP
ncbi:MAG: hypothetical protein ABEI77_09970 [Halorientalis sp.]